MTRHRIIAAVGALAVAAGIAVAPATAQTWNDPSEYRQQANAARAEAERHRRMAESYRKLGAAVVAKSHLDEHCDLLVRRYEAAAESYEKRASKER